MGLKQVAAALVVTLATGAIALPSPARAAEHTFKSEHFALTWSGDAVDPADGDRDGAPDAAERMTDAFERARSMEVDGLGFEEPPTRGRYDLYVSAAESQGYTRVAPGGNGRSRPSVVVIPPSLFKSSARLGDVRAFAGHEYFHAIQLGYDAGEDPWIMEASASWMEGIVAPGSHRSDSYLYGFVPELDLGLASQSGLHDYGAFLFFQFLAERYFGGMDGGAAFIRAVWEDLAVPEAIEGAPDYSSMQSLESNLTERGIGLGDAWREFLLWSWQLRRFERGAAYARTLSFQGWPSAPKAEVTSESCRLTAESPGGDLAGLSGAYARFTSADSQTHSARLTVSGPPGAVALAILGIKGGGSTVRELAFDAGGVATADFSFGGTATHKVTAVLGNGGAAAFDAPLAYSLRIAGESATSATAPGVPSSTIFGTGVTAAGEVSCGGMPAPFAQVVVTQTETVSGTRHEIEVTTDQFGRWSLVTTPEVTSTYTATVADPLLSSSTSAAAPLAVKVAVNIALSDDQIAEGESVAVSGNVAPVHRGVVIVERRRPNGEWETAAETVTEENGSYRAEVNFPGTGLWELRARMPDTGDDDHAPGESSPKAVQVGES